MGLDLQLLIASPIFNHDKVPHVRMIVEVNRDQYIFAAAQTATRKMEEKSSTYVRCWMAHQPKQRPAPLGFIPETELTQYIWADGYGATLRWMLASEIVKHLPQIASFKEHGIVYTLLRSLNPDTVQTPASAFKKCTCTSKNVDWGAGTGFHIPTLKLDPSCPRHGVARLEKN